jgi:hypothetical protein
MPRIVLVLAVLLGAAGTPHRALTEAGTDPTEVSRQELLECALQRSADCLRLVERTVSETKTAPLGKLSSVLLEEWRLSVDSAVFDRPRLVAIEIPEFADLERLLPRPIDWCLVVARVSVCSDGIVRDVALLRSCKYEAVNHAVVHALEGALYRPARTDGGYTTSDAHYAYRLDPRIASE